MKWWAIQNVHVLWISVIWGISPTNQPTKKLHVCLLKPRDSEAVEKLEKQDICNLVGLKTTDCFCCVQWGVNCYVLFALQQFKKSINI